MKKKMAFSWSGGKDSAMALEQLLNDKENFEVTYLLTTLSQDHRRISMHGIREEILDQHAAAIGIPLVKIFITGDDHSSYENEMGKAMNRLKAEGIEAVGFGDIYLEDLKLYREKMLALAGLEAVFPLWGRDTAGLLREFEQRSYKAKICAGNALFFDENTIGSDLSAELIYSLPASMDPCGENGEYHTLIYDAPYFHKMIGVTAGDAERKTYNYKNSEQEEIETRFWFREFMLKE